MSSEKGDIRTQRHVCPGWRLVKADAKEPVVAGEVGTDPPLALSEMGVGVGNGSEVEVGVDFGLAASTTVR